MISSCHQLSIFAQDNVTAADIQNGICAAVAVADFLADLDSYGTTAASKAFLVAAAFNTEFQRWKHTGLLAAKTVVAVGPRCCSVMGVVTQPTVGLCYPLQAAVCYNIKEITQQNAAKKRLQEWATQ
jgi:hypothetical protein